MVKPVVVTKAKVTKAVVATKTKVAAKPTKPAVVAKKVTPIAKPKVEKKQAKDIQEPAPYRPEMKQLEMATEAKRYSDSDLAEFKDIIVKKMASAKAELANLLDQMQNPNANGGNDTDSSYQTLEDGQSSSEKEQLSQLAARQRKFIENLDNALSRIENKTYGICKVTGKLIAKERLRAVPHTTLSMEAKLQQYK